MAMLAGGCKQELQARTWSLKLMTTLPVLSITKVWRPGKIPNRSAFIPKDLRRKPDWSVSSGKGSLCACNGALQSEASPLPWWLSGQS